MNAEFEKERGYPDDEEEIDNKPKSKELQTFKLFSEGKTPVEIVIALDLPTDEVRPIYRDFWGLNNMHKLVEVYDEIKVTFHHFWDYTE